MKIAIVGIGCRFPGGVSSPEALWRLLLDQRETSGAVPAGRWSSYAGRSAADAATLRRTPDRGSFLMDIAGFDAAFFGISPREARLMDPQQRITLEVAWEALEHAGIPVHSLAGSDTGVFVGVGSDDYGRRLLEDLPSIEAWTGIGASPVPWRTGSRMPSTCGGRASRWIRRAPPRWWRSIRPVRACDWVRCRWPSRAG